MCLQDIVQLGWSPACPGRAWLGKFILIVRKPKLLLQILPNSLSQLGSQRGTAGQDGLSCRLGCNPIIVEWIYFLLQSHMWGNTLGKLDSAGFKKIDAKAHTTENIFYFA